MAKNCLLSYLLLGATFHLLLVAVTVRYVNASTPAAAQDPTPFSFFMHDILGGSAPSGRVVAGIITNVETSNLPFAKSNGGVFPLVGGIPLVNNNNGVGNNRLPVQAGLTGATTSIVLNNKGGTLPFVIAGELPAEDTVQKLLFGTITVVDDELAEGHEFGSAVIGKAQGFYLACSLDGSSHTMVVTALFHDGDHEDDTISFFGVHRTATQESQLAVVGGTGKYVNAKGYATIETLNFGDQYTTDGVDTLLKFNVYLTQ